MWRYRDDINFVLYIPGHDKGVGEELAECRTYIAEGIAESEVCGDIEMI